MDSASEFDSLTELPPLPQELRFSSSPLDSLPPLPPSDFTPFSDNKELFHQPHCYDSASPLSLFNRHHSTDLTPFFHNDVAAAPFQHMPNLESMETMTNPFPCLSLSPPSDKKLRHNLRVIPPMKLGSLVKSTFTISPSSASSSSNSGSRAKSSHSIYRMERRRRISDKIKSLEKLMPCEKEMDMATVLEEAHKYIKFLHSQIDVLRWMPLESVYSTAGKVAETYLLRSLTRQQILQVITNSPAARTVLYTRGVCVFSSEQLLTVKMMAQSARNL